MPTIEPPLHLLLCSAIVRGRAYVEEIRRWSARATSLRATPSPLSELLRLVSTVKHFAVIRRISGCHFSKSHCSVVKGRYYANQCQPGCGSSVDCGLALACPALLHD